ncbi:glucosyltransferase domain-containing protein [Metabacillus litoralis]|uniref:glucosyltransferase domain-containing protein n=1 Tax=Metabacillus litoralis TaxID=152268 RepID=UPI001CFCFFE9|nr:glucosyltransferase domain-containing protein [Metabacillus litoralis]
MSPSENIYFLLIAIIVFVVILFIWWIVRKRKKLAVVLTSLLIIGFAGYYAYYPTLKSNTHTERYNTVIEYLVENYPDRKFQVLPKEYEAGYRVGEFRVNDIKTPSFGVSLSVDEEGSVMQTSNWSNQEYPKQKELWRELEFIYGENYTLDKEIAEITKQDEWIDGELTAFALTIDDTPAIALFEYSKGGYSLLELQEAANEGYVYIEEEGFVFIYIDDHHEEEIVTISLENGEEFVLNVNQSKGKLIVRD